MRYHNLIIRLKRRGLRGLFFRDIEYNEEGWPILIRGKTAEIWQDYAAFIRLMGGERTERLRVVAFTGAGMSAESGLGTFRSHGAARFYSFERRMTPTLWERDPKLVLQTYNRRRAELGRASPHRGHSILAQLEQKFDVTVITQNVDDLHERAGSTHVLHLHGNLREARSTANPAFVQDVGYDEIKLGDLCPTGGQLRPNIVWFGEEVHHLQAAAEALARAHLCIVVGTSLQVEPAAALLGFLPAEAFLYIVDPSPPRLFKKRRRLRLHKTTASAGLLEIEDEFDRLYRA
ncbi:MAG: Silent information regulator protein Sir2 [Puniceicoccaceae bacterium 5H]|nr:MAG: Silent information regulator protein Sir2 [Puniceicoccaceae bacterium 5H]